MIDYRIARQKLIELLDTWGRAVPDGLAIVDSRTITKPYGWVFFYDSKTHIATGNPLHTIAGNGPVVVLAATGEVVSLGTARPSQEQIALFEAERGLSGT